MRTNNSIELENILKTYLLPEYDNNKLTNKSLQELFITNLKISNFFFYRILILEVAIKYITDANFENNLGKDWMINLRDNINPILSDHFKKEFNVISGYNQEKLIRKDLVDLGSLGFWTSLFEKAIYKELRGLPMATFSNKPKNINRKFLYKSLTEIKNLRNHIYHHKSLLLISSDIQTSVKSLTFYDVLIKDLISWISPDYINILNLIDSNSTNQISDLQNNFGFLR